MVPETALDLVDLLDLKMLPAWVNETAPTERYAHVEGEEHRGRQGRDHRAPSRERRGGKRSTPNKRRSGVVAGATRTRPSESSDQPASSIDGLRRGARPTFKAEKRQDRSGRKEDRRDRRAPDRRREDRDKISNPIAPPIAVRFLPHPTAFENVIAQIKSGLVAYSLFALARLFLEKPTRYDVRLTPPPESPLWQLGEDGALSMDREFLDRNAFRFTQPNFYKIDITESEPVKGNFTNVARCKLSGTLLGPTNHHDYQRRLRNLFEQRFSRRMSFANYQRQIETVTDPQLVEQWKEDARKITTFSTLRDESPATFSSAPEADRHFRQNYLPGLIRSISEKTVGGVESRHLPDRALNRLVENEWARETRSPSQMMQELATQIRHTGLQVFRHRRGMLFVSPIYPRAFAYEETTLSPQVRTILEAVGTTPGIGRKELADKMIVGLAGEEEDRAKLALASDLHWLISEGHVIEFNDGSLDLPRAKVRTKPQETVAAVVPTAGAGKQAIAIGASAINAEAEIGGS